MEVTYKHIERLDNFQLVKLLKLLLRLEALKCGIPKRSATVSLNITVSDDGEDARIGWYEPEGNNWWLKSNYIKSPYTVFQSKATGMGYEDCKHEVSAKTVKTKRGRKPYNLTKEIKKNVKEVIESGGSYILFINKDYTNGIQRRINKIKEAFKDIGYKKYKDIDVDVYDAGRIADWVNEYFQAISFVYENVLGLKIPDGLKTWDRLNEFEDFQSEYIKNHKIEEKISQILNTAYSIREVTRLTGFSGLGKTRLILEAFRPLPSDDLHLEIIKSSFIYYDANLSKQEIPGFVSKLIDNEVIGTLVVDNCEADLHHRLQTEVRRKNSKLNLITVDFEYEKLSSTTGFNAMELYPDDLLDLVPVLVKKLFPKMNSSDITRITDAVQGFPFLAVLLSTQYSSGDETIGVVDDKQLVNKLIWGRQAVDGQEQEVLITVALFDKLGFEDDLKKEMDFVSCDSRLCSLPGNAEERKKKFYAVCKKFIEKGVLQRRGRYIFIRTKPLSITLASNWWKTVQPEILHSLLDDVTNAGLATALCDQLKNLNFVKEAKDIVERLCSEQGPFGNAEVLNTELGSRLFRSLVEVNPEATCVALVRIFGNMGKDELIKIEKGRRNLVWALEKIVWKKETFSEGMKLLLLFAVAENEKWANNATGEFLQRFHVLLPGTEANLNERFAIIEFAYESDDDYKLLALHALKSALLTHYFTRDVGGEYHGSSRPLVDYRPSLIERNEYWLKCLHLLVGIIKNNQKLAEDAASILSKSIRGLISHGLLEIIPIIKDVAQFKNHIWLEARNDLLQTISFEKEILIESTKEMLKNIVSELTPQNLVEKYKMFVMIPSLSEDIDEDGDYRDNSTKMSKNIAKEFVDQFDKLITSLDIMLNDYQQNGFYFGEELGKSLDSQKRIVFLEKTIDYLKRTDNKVNTIVLTGFLSGIENKNFVKQTILRFINDDVLDKYSYDLTTAFLDEEIFEKIIELSIHKSKNIKRLLNLRYSRGIDLLNSEVINDKLRRLSNYSIEGSWVALSIYYNILFADKNKWDVYRDNIKNIFLKDGIIQNKVYVDMMEVYLKDLINKILKEKDVTFAKHVTKEIISYCSNEDFYSRTNLDMYLQDIFNNLIGDYFVEIWPELSNGIISDTVTYHNLMHMIGSKIDFNDNLVEDVRKKLDSDNGILFKGIPEMIFQWCKKNSPLAARRIARYLPVFSNKKRDSWHPFTLSFIDEFGNDMQVLSGISANMGTYSWVGSVVPLLVGQQKLYEQLKNHKLKIVREWARKNIEYLKEDIKKEKIDDEELYL